LNPAEFALNSPSILRLGEGIVGQIRASNT